MDNCYDGKRYTMRFERGAIARPFVCMGDAAGRHGLYVRFKPDPEIFTDTTEFDLPTLLTRLREQAFLNAGIRIVLRDEREELPVEADGGEARDIARLLEAAEAEAAEKADVFEVDPDEEVSVDNTVRFEEAVETRKSGYPEYDLKYDGGIRSFVEHLNKAKHVELIHPEVIYMKAEKGDITAEVAMQYNDSYTETIVTFANNMSTIDGGTHEVGFKSAVTKVMNAYARKCGALKDSDKNLSGEDAREGLCAVVSVKLPDAQFESQTKAKLGNSEIRTIVTTLFPKSWRSTTRSTLPLPRRSSRSP